MQPWAGGEPTQPATVETSGWGLDDGEPRGALAGDEELRAGVEQVLAAAVSGPSGTGAELVPGSLRLVFADDLAGSRLVVAVARTDAPGAARDVGSVLVGPAGAAADGLALRSTPPVPVAGTAPAVAQVLDADDGRRLVAVVPRGARVSVSDAVQVDAAGTRLGREWREVEVSGDGVVDTVLDAEPGSGLAVLRIDSAAGYAADGPVAEVVLPWPGPFTEAPLVAAQEVVARGPHEFRDGVVPRPVGDDPAAQDVSSAMEVLGRPSADDVRLLYASADGADAGRGAQGWSSVVAVPAGDGSVVVWQHHLDDGGTVRTSTVAAPADADGERVLLRIRVDQQTDLVGVWDPDGTLGTVQVDGADLVMPEALGFRWFPVTAGADVVVDGEAVPAAAPEPATSWLLPGEQRTGPEPLFRD